jgi:hypothetical protein
MKIWQLLISLMFWSSSISQINIADVGDGWKGKVQQALDTIQKYDTVRYNNIITKCNNIGYWNNTFATTEPPHTILIPTSEMNFGNIYNICAILIHESYHLLIYGRNMNPNQEEYWAYSYELDFLTKVPNVDGWLIQNAQNKINYYSKP